MINKGLLTTIIMLAITDIGIYLAVGNIDRSAVALWIAYHTMTIAYQNGNR